MNLTTEYVNHMRTRVIICPNSECQKKIKEPIFLSTQKKHWYACPHCFFELNAYAVAREEHKGTTVEENLQDSVFGKAEAIQVRNPLDALAPNRRFRRP